MNQLLSEQEEGNEQKDWERLPDETADAYSAYCIYQELSARDRTLRRVAAIRKHGKAAVEADESLIPVRGGTVIERWSAANCWVERAAARDDWLAEYQRQKREAELDSAITLIAKEARELFVLFAAKQKASIAELDMSKPPSMQWFAVLSDQLLKVLGFQEQRKVDVSMDMQGELAVYWDRLGIDYADDEEGMDEYLDATD